jgi:hypothetical protein
MKILFLIQSHKDPDQLLRLVRVLRRGCPDSLVLVSHDETAAALPPALFSEDHHVHVITGRGGRGDFLILDGYLNALTWLQRNHVDYDWLINLSGSDYPVSSLSGLQAELRDADHDGFLHHFDPLHADLAEMAPMSWPPGRGYGRYYYQYRKLKGDLSKPERILLAAPRMFTDRYVKSVRINTAYGLMIGTKSRVTPFTEDFRCYAGSYWHSIRRRCAEYLISFANERPDVVTYFKNVLIPDESFIQTVLVNNSSFRFVNGNRRYFDMTKSHHGHPKLLTDHDVQKILGKNYFFARKLERQSGERVLDTLDEVACS